jgi:hypothetical protein
MTKKEYYEHELGIAEDWTEYLLKHSNLPGPRANLELMQAFVEMGSENDFIPLLDNTPELAPVNSPEEFLAFCGTVGLGELVANGMKEYMPDLRNQASDPRWRIREAVAMGMQIIGRHNFPMLENLCKELANGNLLEQRAAACGICSPSLLSDADRSIFAINLLEKITGGLSEMENRKSDEFKILCKGLSYCWSIAIEANPVHGKPPFEKLVKSDDPDLLRIAKANLKKNRLIKMDSDWVARLVSDLKSAE